jgi:hypothetical protein
MDGNKIERIPEKEKSCGNFSVQVGGNARLMSVLNDDIWLISNILSGVNGSWLRRRQRE